MSYLLSPKEIGDALDLEVEAEYPCSDGGVVGTVSVDVLLRKQHRHTVEELEEEGLLIHTYNREHIDTHSNCRACAVLKEARE